MRRLPCRTRPQSPAGSAPVAVPERPFTKAKSSEADPDDRKQPDDDVERGRNALLRQTARVESGECLRDGVSGRDLRRLRVARVARRRALPIGIPYWPGAAPAPGGCMPGGVCIGLAIPRSCIAAVCTPGCGVFGTCA